MQYVGVKSQYEKLVTLDAKKPELESEFITFDKGVYLITDDSLTALKSTFTSYLKEKKLKDYNQLQKVSCL